VNFHLRPRDNASGLACKRLIRASSSAPLLAIQLPTPNPDLHQAPALVMEGLMLRALNRNRQVDAYEAASAFLQIKRPSLTVGRTVSEGA